MVAREVYILQKLSKMKGNIFTIKLIDLVANDEAYEDQDKLSTLCIITNYERLDLSALLTLKTELDFEQFKILSFNLLVSLHFIHSAGVVHRDLATKNILINANCQVQLCDFGWSRTIPESQASNEPSSTKD